MAFYGFLFGLFIVFVICVNIIEHFGFGIFFVIAASIVAIVALYNANQKQKIEKEKQKRSLELELERESQPCFACKVVPNKRNHKCEIKISIKIEKDKVGNRYIDELIDIRERVKSCDKIHRTESIALGQRK